MDKHLTFARPALDDHEAIYTYRDAAVGLELHVAIHSTRLGPAIGGTRWLHYENSAMALADAKRLSKAMSYKCALAGLPSGGGKAVIRAVAGRQSPQLLASYGAFLNRIGDVFATGEDVGFSLDACEQLRAWTPFVAGTASSGNGDPCEHTAVGVFHAISSLSDRLWPSRPELAGRRVAIQGLGGVGRRLAHMLADAGAELIVADIDAAIVDGAVTKYNAVPVATETIHEVDVDIFAPCALGGIINDKTVDAIRATAVVGAANNQLSDVRLADRLLAKGVIWAPDFVVNAGGVVGAAEEIARMPGRLAPPDAPIERRLAMIGERCGQLYDQARRQGVTIMSTAMENAERLMVGAANRTPDNASRFLQTFVENEMGHGDGND